MNASDTPDARVEEILERAVAFYESSLWESDTGGAARSRLAAQDLDSSVLRAFRVGYAPGGWEELIAHLGQWQYSVTELHEAGIADLSDRGHLHARFRARVMFPVRDRSGQILGFAALATNPGPSWPKWLTSPERGRYRGASAIFGIDRAGAAIAEAGRALVLADCRDVLRLHQQGRMEAVGVIRSPITRTHLEQLAAELGEDVADLSMDRNSQDEEGPGGVLIARALVPSDANALAEADREARRPETARDPTGGVRPDFKEPLTPRARALLQVARGLVGIGIPLGWVWIMGPDSDAADGGATDFIIAVGGVAATYLVLTIVASLISARIRARSRARRMRTPWEMGLTEWQPSAWTYHLFEDVLIGAAVVSVAICMLLFLTIGGFTA